LRLDAHGRANDVDTPVVPEPPNDVRVVVLGPPVVPAERLPAQNDGLSVCANESSSTNPELPEACDRRRSPVRRRRGELSFDVRGIGSPAAVLPRDAGGRQRHADEGSAYELPRVSTDAREGDAHPV